MGTKDRMKVAVVIPTCNRAALLAKCLNSIEAQVFPISSIFVVDNGSTDNTAEIVNKHQKAMLIRLERNVGIDAALAIGLDRAIHSGADAALITDDDSLLLPDTLSTLVDTMIRLQCRSAVNALPIVSMPGKQLISPRIHHGRLITTQAEFLKSYGRIVSTNKVHFNGSLLHRDIIQAVGLPDARFFSGDETAYGERILERGFGIVIDAEANLLHPLMPVRMMRIPVIGYFPAWDLPEWKAQHYPTNALLRRRRKHGICRFLLVDVPLVSLVYLVRLAFEKHPEKKARHYLLGLLNGICQGVRVKRVSSPTATNE